MTREDIIRMARYCDLGEVCGPLDTLLDHEWESLHRFAALVAAAERHECAKIVDGNADGCNGMTEQILRSNAAAIRARGQS